MNRRELLMMLVAAGTQGAVGSSDDEVAIGSREYVISDRSWYNSVLLIHLHDGEPERDVIAQVGADVMEFARRWGTRVYIRTLGFEDEIDVWFDPDLDIDEPRVSVPQ